MDLAYHIEFLSKYAYVDSAALHTFLRLELFKHLPVSTKGTIPMARLAEHVGASPQGSRGIRVLCELLAATDFLTINEAREVALHPTLAALLADADFVEQLHQASRWWWPVQQLGNAVTHSAPVQYNGRNWDVLAHYATLFPTSTVPRLTKGTESMKDQLFDRIARHFLRTQALICTAKMDLLTHLCGQAVTLSHLADVCQAEPAGLTMLLDVLVHLNIAQSSHNTYCLSAEAERFLNRRTITTYNQGWQISQLFWEALGRLDEVILFDRRVLDLQDQEQSNKFYRALARYNTTIFPAYFRLTRHVATAVASGKSLMEASILDVGAGSGAWGAGFAAIEPSATVVFLDQAQVLPQTSRNIERLQLQKQARFWTGDLLQVDYGEAAFDVILLGQICHTQNPANLPGLFERLARALRPDGLLILADLILNDQRNGPLEYLYFAVKEFTSTQGDLLSLREYSELLGAVGLNIQRTYPVPGLEIICASRSSLTLPGTLPQ